MSGRVPLAQPVTLDFRIVSVRFPELGLEKLGAVGGADPRLSDARAPLPHSHSVSGLAAGDALRISPTTGELQMRNRTHGRWHTVFVRNNEDGFASLYVDQTEYS